ncbi:RNA polymerase sigma factor [Kitasatospora sp. NPDC059327]|uniref:RNA polymerase sigma factor n=1 Tax=Kitasatospora sp. NPDC059327 TaxID=3346803 RepID=UPI0036818AAB
MTTRTEGPRDLVLAAYDRQVDGLFTYCLSVLCEHDAATAALREVRELALRHGARLAEPGLVRAWLYSLARYCCLRRLEDGAGFNAVGGTGAVVVGAVVGAVADAGAGDAAAGLPAAEVGRRRRELASLAWPEAAGTDPEQREALELSVRHRLSPIEVAAVLGVPFETSRALLASAEAEVGRTRAALLVLGVGSCPELDRLGGAGAESWRDWVLGPALRRELVQHVTDCPTCRGTAERVAGEVAQGAEGLSGLPVPAAPPTTGARQGDGAAFLPHAAAAAAWRRTSAPAPVTEPGLRFDQGGFPRHRAPDSGRARAVRRRVVTTGVLAAVLAAPVVALWAGHRGGGTGAAAAVSSVRVEDDGRAAGHRPSGSGPTAGQAGGIVGAVGAAPAVAGLELAGAGPGNAETLLPGIHGPAILGPAIPVPGRGATPLGSPTLTAAPAPTTGTGPGAAPGGAGPADGPAPAPAPVGLLTVEAGEYGNRTVLTLTDSGSTEIHWHAEVTAPWLRLSRDAGTLAPGQRITVIVTVDEDLAPNTHWTARIALPPSQAVVTLEGGPQHRGGSTPVPGEPTATPTDPAPTPTGTAPSTRPTGPGPTASPSSPAPSPSSPVPTTTTPPPGGTPTAAPSATPTGTASGAPTGTASTGASASPATGSSAPGSPH